MGWEVIDCQAMNRGFGSRRGTDGIPGYNFTILRDSEEYSLNVSASETVLSSRGISQKGDYEKFCREVIKQGIDNGHFNKVKKRWENNDKNCFILVLSLPRNTEQVKITYGATWDMEAQDAWLPSRVIRIE